MECRADGHRHGHGTAGEARSPGAVAVAPKKRPESPEKDDAMKPLPAAALLASMLSLSTAADAQPVMVMTCIGRASLGPFLLEKHGERPAGLGPTADGKSIAELFVDPLDGSWSLAVVHPDGKACMLVVGTGWEPTVPPGVPS
jgi:hypothetical protein